jgi:ribosomal protein S18 acetylase RimI-like enzyme
MIRLFQESDRAQLKAITADVFGPAAVDYYLELRFGIVQGRDWRWRKVRHIDDDIRGNAGGIFVYDDGGPVDRRVAGYITVTLDREAGIGRIPNLAVAAHAQSRGVGRALVEHALDYLRSEGMLLARVETLEGNAVGKHLYPALGFEEVVRQIYYVAQLGTEPAISRRRLYVVARDQAQLYERLQRDLASAPGVEVIQDRRNGQRRRAPSPAVPERRVADRRVRDVQVDLERYGRAVVEL